MSLRPFSAIILYGLLKTVEPLYAQNWVSNNVPSYPWHCVSSSADGSALAAASGHYGPIYTSTNSGVIWRTNNAPNYAWQSVASSADGTKMAAAGFSTFMSPIAV